MAQQQKELADNGSFLECLPLLGLKSAFWGNVVVEWTVAAGQRHREYLCPQAVVGQ